MFILGLLLLFFCGGAWNPADAWASATSRPTSRPTSRSATSRKIQHPHHILSKRAAKRFPKKKRIAVWIDADPAVGLLGRDVDDGFAILQAFRSPELDVRGISVVFGNAPLPEAVRIIRVLAKLLHVKDLPVVAGASSHIELGKQSAASRALARALQKQKLTILALGPATNVATVLLRHPRLARQIHEIVSVAGRRPGQRFLTGWATVPHRDFNFEKDPQAFRILLQSNVPLVFAPWEISSKVWIKSVDLLKMTKAGAAARWLVQPATVWLGIWAALFGVDGFNPFDTLAVGYLTSPQLLDCERLPMRIEQASNDTPQQAFLGKIVEKKSYLFVRKDDKGAKKVLYCFRPKAGFHADLIQRLLSP